MLRIGRVLIILFEVFCAYLRDVGLFPDCCVDGEGPSEYSGDGAVPGEQCPPNSFAYTLLVYGEAGSLEAVCESASETIFMCLHSSYIRWSPSARAALIATLVQ